MKFSFLAVIVVLIFENAFSWKQSTDNVVKVNSISWFEWYYDTFYNIVYVVLMSAILVCALYNFFKNKFMKNSEKPGWIESCKEMDVYSKVVSFMEPENNGKGDQSGVAFNFNESENELRQRLRETQEEIQSLRTQLTLSMDNKTELETTLAIIDKEKISSEMQLELERVHGVLELERIKKENMLVKREIQTLLEEKDLAEKEVERLERDVRISRSAAVDADFLGERLVSVRKEAEVLKQLFSQLAEEKEKASSVVSKPSFSHTYQYDVDVESESSWSPPAFAREYMALD